LWAGVAVEDDVLAFMVIVESKVGIILGGFQAC
jgi:hypothetical protein